MSKEDVYELFGAREAERVLVTTPNLEDPRRVGSAASLYELDFSADDTRPTIPEFASAAVAQVVELAQPISKETIDFPDNVIARFDEVLSLVVNQSHRVKFSLHDMERLTLHLGPMSSEERWYFKQYCKQHESLDYFGENVFGLAERVTPNTYWPGVVDVESQVDIGSLVARTVDIMAHAHMPRQEFQVKHILGIVKSQGIELYTDELHAFMARLAAHPGVLPREDGSFHVARIPDEQRDEQPLQPKRIYTVRQPKDISRALKKINASDEMKRTRDLAINRADNRQRGRHRRRRGAKAQGKRHGKNLSFDQLLQQSLSNAPQPSKE